MGFEVKGTEEFDVRLTATQHGVEYYLFHRFRQPTASELRQYSRMRTEVQARGRRRVSMKHSPAEADEWLWNKTIVSVEGYTIEGKEITAERPDWKELVPLTHKVEAISYIEDVSAEEREEREKNSLESSDGS